MEEEKNSHWTHFSDSDGPLLSHLLNMASRHWLSSHPEWHVQCRMGFFFMAVFMPGKNQPTKTVQYMDVDMDVTVGWKHDVKHGIEKYLSILCIANLWCSRDNCICFLFFCYTLCWALFDPILILFYEGREKQEGHTQHCLGSHLEMLEDHSLSWIKPMVSICKACTSALWPFLWPFISYSCFRDKN